MKKYLFSFVAVMALSALVAFKSVEAPAWSIDATHSSVNFNVKHFFTPTQGSFDTFTGDIKFDPANPAESSVSFEVDVKSVNTGNEKRDGHLMSPDFFDAATYPKMTFKSSAIKKKGKAYIATGELTIKETTKTVELPVQFLGATANPFKEGSQVAGFKIETSINRNDYGVGTGDWAATAVIGDEVNITILLEVGN